MDTGEEEAMRRLYLHLIENDPDSIFRELAEPLKEDLMATPVGAQLLQGNPTDVTVGFEEACTTVSKNIFSIGRWPICDVEVPANDKDEHRLVSRMHLWVFNLPGGLAVVDGWSAS